MNENDERIVALLTQIRDNQREAIDLQKTTVARHRIQVRVYYIVTTVILAATFYFIYTTCHH